MALQDPRDCIPLLVAQPQLVAFLMDLSWCVVRQALMEPLMIVEREVVLEPGRQF